MWENNFKLTCQHNFSRGKDEQHHLWFHHLINKTRKQFRFITVYKRRSRKSEKTMCSAVKTIKKRKYNCSEYLLMDKRQKENKTSGEWHTRIYLTLQAQRMNQTTLASTCSSSTNKTPAALARNRKLIPSRKWHSWRVWRSLPKPCF